MYETSFSVSYTSFIKKGGSAFDGCEYCQERLVSGNDKAADGYEKMK
jgi:hypothetical protein